MRGKLPNQCSMFYAIDVESRIRADHPLRPIKRMVDEELAKMATLFDAAYTRDNGRPSVPPERLLKALLLQCLYSIRSETQLIERIDTDLLFRWFLDMDPAQDAFDQTTFTHNRPRLQKHGIVAAFFDGVVRRAMQAGLSSDEHFTVDGTLIESHASIKSFVRKDGSDDDGGDGNGFKPRNSEVNFHGQRRGNDTHASTTDPQARLYKKSDGQAAKLYPHGPRAGGEPARAGDERVRQRSGGRRRAGGGTGDGRSTAPPSRHHACHPGQRQSVRPGPLSAGVGEAPGPAAHGDEGRCGRRRDDAHAAEPPPQERPPVHRSAATHATSPTHARVPSEPALPQEDRRSIRLDQNRRDPRAHKTHRPLEDQPANAPGGGGLQPREDAKAGGVTAPRHERSRNRDRHTPPARPNSDKRFIAKGVFSGLLGVSNADKTALGLTLVDQTKTPIAPPVSAPLLNVIGATPGVHTLRFADSNTPDRRGKPAGTIGLQLFVAVATGSVNDPAVAPFKAFVTRQPYGVVFDASSSGKLATYFARWQNAKGEAGPWSNPTTFTIVA